MKKEVTDKNILNKILLTMLDVNIFEMSYCPLWAFLCRRKTVPYVTEQ